MLEALPEWSTKWTFSNGQLHRELIKKCRNTCTVPVLELTSWCACQGAAMSWRKWCACDTIWCRLNLVHWTRNNYEHHCTYSWKRIWSSYFTERICRYFRKINTKLISWLIYCKKIPTGPGCTAQFWRITTNCRKGMTASVWIRKASSESYWKLEIW